MNGYIGRLAAEAVDRMRASASAPRLTWHLCESEAGSVYTADGMHGRRYVVSCGRDEACELPAAMAVENGVAVARGGFRDRAAALRWCEQFDHWLDGEGAG